MVRQLLSNPAFWAAIAASFSAIAAIANWRQQRLNFLHSIRPELNLDDWKLTNLDSNVATKITVGQVENLGRGPALDIWGSLQVPSASKPAYAAFLHKSHLTTILKSGETKPLECQGSFYWEHSTKLDPRVDSSFINLRMSLYYFDLYGNQYELRLGLFAFRNTTVAAGVEVLTPNLYLSERETFMKSRWCVRLKSRRSRLSNWFRKNLKYSIKNFIRLSDLLKLGKKPG